MRRGKLRFLQDAEYVLFTMPNQADRVKLVFDEEGAFEEDDYCGNIHQFFKGEVVPVSVPLVDGIYLLDDGSLLVMKGNASGVSADGLHIFEACS